MTIRITLRTSVQGTPVPAAGIAGALGATKSSSSTDLETGIEIEQADEAAEHAILGEAVQHATIAHATITNTNTIDKE